jgi:hypothetical protein
LLSGHGIHAHLLQSRSRPVRFGHDSNTHATLQHVCSVMCLWWRTCASLAKSSQAALGWEASWRARSQGEKVFTLGGETPAGHHRSSMQQRPPKVTPAPWPLRQHVCALFRRRGPSRMTCSGWAAAAVCRSSDSSHMQSGFLILVARVITLHSSLLSLQ